MSAHASVSSWLDAFAECVRTRDFEAGRALFAEDARGFGTRTEVMESRAELERLQWRPTWLRTRGFEFESDSVRCFPADDDRQYVVTATWHSEGVDTPEDWDRQAPYARKGRCTLVLRADEEGRLRAYHSHFSMMPGNASRAETGSAS